MIGWVPPIDVVDDKVNTFTLIGPGRMPTPEDAYDEYDDNDEYDADYESEDGDGDEFDESPDAVIAPESVSDPKSVTGDALTPAAAEQHSGEGESQHGHGHGARSWPGQPKKKPEPMRWGTARVKQAVRWRYRKVRRKVGRAANKIGPVKFVRTSRTSKNLGKAYWKRVQSRPRRAGAPRQADVVDRPGRRRDLGRLEPRAAERPDRPVVLGLPAARRELDQLKVSAGHG